MGVGALDRPLALGVVLGMRVEGERVLGMRVVGERVGMGVVGALEMGTQTTSLPSPFRERKSIVDIGMPPSHPEVAAKACMKLMTWPGLVHDRPTRLWTTEYSFTIGSAKQLAHQLIASVKF